MRSTLFLTTIGLSVITAPAQVIINGDFEQPVILEYAIFAHEDLPFGDHSPYPLFRNLPGWELFSSWGSVAGTKPHVDIGAGTYTSSQALDINGWGPGGIRQVLNTIPGHKYELTLTWLGNPAKVSVPIVLKAYLNLQGHNYAEFLSASSNPITPSIESWVFQAQGGDLLELVSGTKEWFPGVDSPNGIVFDDISVVLVDASTPLSKPRGDSPVVPEPSQWGMIAGSAALLLAVYRRRVARPLE